MPLPPGDVPIARDAAGSTWLCSREAVWAHSDGLRGAEAELVTLQQEAVSFLCCAMATRLIPSALEAAGHNETHGFKACGVCWTGGTWLQTGNVSGAGVELKHCPLLGADPRPGPCAWAQLLVGKEKSSGLT